LRRLHQFSKLLHLIFSDLLARPPLAFAEARVFRARVRGMGVPHHASQRAPPRAMHQRTSWLLNCCCHRAASNNDFPSRPAVSAPNIVHAVAPMSVIQTGRFSFARRERPGTMMAHASSLWFPVRPLPTPRRKISPNFGELTFFRPFADVSPQYTTRSGS